MTRERRMVDFSRNHVFERRHYQRIAETLAQTRPPQFDLDRYETATYMKWHQIVDRFITMFQWDNANFDRERFLTWCYGNV